MKYVFIIVLVLFSSVAQANNYSNQKVLVNKYNDYICEAALRDTWQGFKKSLDLYKIHYAEAAMYANCEFYYKGKPRISKIFHAIANVKERPAVFSNRLMNYLVDQNKEHYLYKLIIGNNTDLNLFDEIVKVYQQSGGNTAAEEELRRFLISLCTKAKRSKLPKFNSLYHRYCA